MDGKKRKQLLYLEGALEDLKFFCTPKGLAFLVREHRKKLKERRKRTKRKAKL